MKNMFIGVVVGILICLAGRISHLVLFEWSYPDLGMLEEVYRPLYEENSCIDLRPLNKKLKEILEKHKNKNPKYNVAAFAYVYMHYDDFLSEDAAPVYILIYDISISRIWDQRIRAQLWNEIKDDINAEIKSYFDKFSKDKNPWVSTRIKERDVNSGCYSCGAGVFPQSKSEEK